jgi:hypothetical protein
LLTGQVGCEAYVAVALFLLSAGLNTFTVPGCKTSMLDMAPAYSGTTLQIQVVSSLFLGSAGLHIIHRTLIKVMKRFFLCRIFASICFQMFATVVGKNTRKWRKILQKEESADFFQRNFGANKYTRI